MMANTREASIPRRVSAELEKIDQGMFTRATIGVNQQFLNNPTKQNEDKCTLIKQMIAYIKHAEPDDILEFIETKIESFIPKNKDGGLPSYSKELIKDPEVILFIRIGILRAQYQKLGYGITKCKSQFKLINADIKEKEIALAMLLVNLKDVLQQGAKTTLDDEFEENVLNFYKEFSEKVNLLIAEPQQPSLLEQRIATLKQTIEDFSAEPKAKLPMVSKGLSSLKDELRLLGEEATKKHHDLLEKAKEAAEEAKTAYHKCRFDRGATEYHLQRKKIKADIEEKKRALAALLQDLKEAFQQDAKAELDNDQFEENMLNLYKEFNEKVNQLIPDSHQPSEIEQRIVSLKQIIDELPNELNKKLSIPISKLSALEDSLEQLSEEAKLLDKDYADLLISAKETAEEAKAAYHKCQLDRGIIKCQSQQAKIKADIKEKERALAMRIDNLRKAFKQGANANLDDDNLEDNMRKLRQEFNEKVNQVLPVSGSQQLSAIEQRIVNSKQTIEDLAKELITKLPIPMGDLSLLEDSLKQLGEEAKSLDKEHNDLSEKVNYSREKAKKAYYKCRSKIKRRREESNKQGISTTPATNTENSLELLGKDTKDKNDKDHADLSEKGNDTREEDTAYNDCREKLEKPDKSKKQDISSTSVSPIEHTIALAGMAPANELGKDAQSQESINAQPYPDDFHIIEDGSLPPTTSFFQRHAVTILGGALGTASGIAGLLSGIGVGALAGAAIAAPLSPFTFGGSIVFGALIGGIIGATAAGATLGALFAAIGAHLGRDLGKSVGKNQARNGKKEPLLSAEDILANIPKSDEPLSSVEIKLENARKAPESSTFASLIKAMGRLRSQPKEQANLQRPLKFEQDDGLPRTTLTPTDNAQSNLEQVHTSITRGLKI